MTFSFNTAAFSILSAIGAHAAFNTVSKFLGGLFKGVEPRVQMPFETLMALCGTGVALFLVAITKGRLAYPRKVETDKNRTSQEPI
jgi:hypothetical protein